MNLWAPARQFYPQHAWRRGRESGGSDPWPELAAYADFNNDVYKLPELGSDIIVGGGFPAHTFGSELAVNGDFATNTDWSGTNWTISGGVATHTPGSVNTLSETIAALTPGATYVCTVTVSGRTAGSVNMGVTTPTSQTFFPIQSTNGTFTGYLTATSAATILRAIPDSAFDGSIDNVSLKEVTNFAASPWVPGIGWTVSGGTANRTSGTSASLLQTIPATAVDKVYQVTFTVSGYSGTGSITPSLAVPSGPAGPGASANGTYTQYLKATGAHTQFVIAANTGTNATVDNVSFKEVTLTATGRTYGSELILNGDFGAAFVSAPNYSTGWVAKTPLIGTETVSLTVNQLRMGGDASNAAYVDQTISIVSGTTYEINWTHINNVNLDITIGSSQGGSQYLSYAAPATAASYRIIFNATATGTAWVRLSRMNANTGNFDNFSITAITALGTYPKRTATFTEWFAYTAASAVARTYTDSGGIIRNTVYGLNGVSDADFSGHTHQNVTPTYNTAVAPDSTTTATRFTGGGSGPSNIYKQNTNMGTVGKYIYSFYAKAETATTLIVNDPNYGTQATFDLSAGSVTNGAGTGYITSVGSGWYRCSVLHNNTAALNPYWSLNIGTATTNTMLFWGPVVQTGVQTIAELIAFAGAGSASPGVNAPRFTYINTDRQLRLENAGTNLCLRSQELDNAAWSTTTLNVVTANASTAPDGTTTADKLVPTTSSGYHFLTTASNISVVNGTVYTYSAYVKADGYGYALLLDFATGKGVNFNLTTGASNTGSDFSAPTSSGSQSIGNGWWRVWLTLTAASTVFTPRIYPVNDASSDSQFTGDGTSGILAWGVQVEASAFVTDYIPTVGSTSGRFIETARLSPEIEAIMQRAGGTMVTRTEKFTPELHGRIVGLVNPVNLISHSGTSQTSVRAETSGSSLFATPGSGTTASPMGIASAFDIAGRSIVANGGTVATDATLTGARTTVYLSQAGAGSNYAAGYWDFVGLSPERLPNATLQALAVAA